MVVAGAVALSGRWNTALERTPVGIDGAVGSRACDVAPVLLTADGMEPVSTPMRSLLCASDFSRFVGCSMVLTSNLGRHRR